LTDARYAGDAGTCEKVVEPTEWRGGLPDYLEFASEQLV
jgi:hypothetical protein